MANAIKRIQWSRDAQTQDTVVYYMFQKAKLVSTAGTASQSQLDLAGRIYNQSVNMFAVCMVCATNSAIGSAIDSGAAVLEGDLDWVVTTDQWDNLAEAGV